MQTYDVYQGSNFDILIASGVAPARGFGKIQMVKTGGWEAAISNVRDVEVDMTDLDGSPLVYVDDVNDAFPKIIEAAVLERFGYDDDKAERLQMGIF